MVNFSKIWRIVFNFQKHTAPPPPDAEIASTSPRESANGSSPTGPLLPHLNLRAAANAAHGHHHGGYQAPRKMPRSDIHLMNVAPSHYSGNGAQLSLMHNNRWDSEDFMDEFSPPHKRAKMAPSSGTSSSSGSSSHALNTNISVESGDETYNYESDSETALSPYGPSATSLHRLLGAVENVLTEEREMAMTLAQLEAMRTMIDSVEETRKRTLGKLEAALIHQLNSIKGLASPECVQATIAEKQRADEEANRTSSATTDANATPASNTTANPSAQQTSSNTPNPQSPEKTDDVKMQVDPTPAPPAPTPALIPSPTSTITAPNGAVNTTSINTASVNHTAAPSASVDNKETSQAATTATDATASNNTTSPIKPPPHVGTLEQELPKIVESQAALEAAEAHVEQVMGPLRDAHHSILAPSLTLPLQLLSSLPPELETAAVDLSSVFANATLLQLGSQADVEAFKQFFVQSLAQSKVRINQEVAMLFETLSALKTRQALLGQNTFIDQLQLRGLSTDLHELKQRVVHASRAVQNAFVQLVSQFTEQIETAKRIYQESAGNNVKLLDEIVRAQMTPQLTSQVDLLKRQLLAHVNCVRANLAYLDTLVLNTE